MNTEARKLWPVSGAMLLCLVAGNASSQERDWSIKPRVTVTETLTDNVRVDGTNRGKQSDLVNEISPGVHIDARTARLKAYIDYALHGQFYTRNSEFNQTQNSLNAFGSFEAVENWFFVDFSGVIAQQAISAFGVQSPSNSSINNNSTETSTYRLSPYIRGQLGGLVDYSLRYSYSTTQSHASSVSDINISDLSGQLRGSTPFQRLAWTVDASQQQTDYSAGRDTDAEQLRGMLTYSLVPEFRVSLSAGRESNNYGSLNSESHSTHGYGFDWSPTERTQIAAFKESRFFGDGHNVSISHRFPRSSIRFSDVRNVSVLPNQFETIGLGTVYDLYFQQFASLIPDPVARANFVNKLLALAGIPPNRQVTSDFLSSQASVQRTQNLALAFFGVRNSITLLFNRTTSQSLQGLASRNFDFSQNDLTEIRQKGVSINFSHRLSELSSLNASASRQESTGGGNGPGSSNLKATTMTYVVTLSTALGAKTTGSLSVRHAKFDSADNPYTENAIVGTVSYVY